MYNAMPFLVGIGSVTYFLVKMKIPLFSKFQNFSYREV